MNRQPRFLSLRVKPVISFTAVAVLSVGLITFFYYQNARAQLVNDIRERLHDIVAIGALQVDVDKHAQLTDPSQQGGETYMELKKTLQNIRDSGTNIEFVYTMRMDAQGNIIFVVDAEDSSSSRFSPLGVIYEEPSDLLKTNFSTMRGPIREENIYSDEYGDHLSGYAPLFASDGRREGVLGVDISATDVTARERELLRNALIFFGISSLVAALIGGLLGYLITQPISTLTEGARKIAAGDLSHRITLRTRDETEILAETFNTMAERLHQLVSGLEDLVAERTDALTRRTAQLEAAAQVARQAAAFQDTPTLVNNAVRLISNRFGFYHAGLFLLDEHGEYAVLQAASSDGGQRMLARGHRLRVGSQGIVGYVAAQKRARIALDTGADAVYFDNPDLPDTRSEAALPLILRERVIGVLDIQSEKPQAFTQEDIETFQTLADQLSLAIGNARLFEEMETALQQLEQSAAQRTRQAWSEIAAADMPVVQYTPMGVREIGRGEPAGQGILNIPISLYNQKIGAIKVRRKDETGVWSPQEEAMLREIAMQVGLALENARLLSEAQKRAARERTIADITSRIGSAFDLDAILRVTAQEIGKALSDSSVDVVIQAIDEEGRTK